MEAQLHDERTLRQQLIDKIRHEIENKGLTQISGARFVEVERGGRIIEANATVEGYVGHLTDAEVICTINMYASLGNRETMPVLFNDGADQIPLHNHEDSIPDIVALKKECEENAGLLSSYQVGCVFEYIDVLEKSCIHWHKKCTTNQ